MDFGTDDGRANLDIVRMLVDPVGSVKTGTYRGGLAKHYA
jgi:hypothetical protein